MTQLPLSGLGGRAGFSTDVQATWRFLSHAGGPRRCSAIIARWAESRCMPAKSRPAPGWCADSCGTSFRTGQTCRSRWFPPTAPTTTSTGSATSSAPGCRGPGRAAGQAEREAAWQPRLAPHLPLALPVQMALGQPADGYPFTWSVYE